jgi:hypothetical protein
MLPTIPGLGYAVLGALIASALIYLAQFSFKQTWLSWKKIKENRLEEENDWKTKDFGKRQTITNKYLFLILQFFLLANVLWLIPNFFDFIPSYANGEYSFTLKNPLMFLLTITTSSCYSLAFLSYLIGIGKIMRYLKLRSLG